MPSRKPAEQPVRWQPDLLGEPFVPRWHRQPVPAAATGDAPLRCMTVNAEWASHVSGLLDVLLWPDMWQADAAQLERVYQEVEKLQHMLAVACPDEGDDDGTGEPMTAGMAQRYDYAYLVERYTDWGTPPLPESPENQGWKVRKPTMVAVNEIGRDLALTGSGFSLAPGTYYLRAEVPNYGTDKAIARLVDTHTHQVYTGSVGYSAEGATTRSFVSAKVTITRQTTFLVENQVAETDAGVPVFAGGRADRYGNHLFTRIEVWRVYEVPGGHAIRHDGDPLPDQPALNFTGNGVEAWDDPNNAATVVQISDRYHAIQHNGISEPHRPALNFTGSGVDVTDNDADERTDVTITDRFHMVQWERATQPLRRYLNFTGNVQVADDAAWDTTVVSVPDRVRAIQDAGVAVPYRPVLNFTGSGVDVTDNDADERTDVTITDTTLAVQQDGVPFNKRAALNFTGDGVTVSDDAANDATVVTVTGGTSSGSRHEIRETGIALPDRPALDFTGGVDVIDHPDTGTTEVQVTASNVVKVVVNNEVVKYNKVIFELVKEYDGTPGSVASAYEALPASQQKQVLCAVTNEWFVTIYRQIGVMIAEGYIQENQEQDDILNLVGRMLDLGAVGTGVLATLGLMSWWVGVGLALGAISADIGQLFNDVTPPDPDKVADEIAYVLLPVTCCASERLHGQAFTEARFRDIVLACAPSSLYPESETLTAYIQVVREVIQSKTQELYLSFLQALEALAEAVTLGHVTDLSASCPCGQYTLVAAEADLVNDATLPGWLTVHSGNHVVGTGIRFEKHAWASNSTWNEARWVDLEVDATDPLFVDEAGNPQPVDSVLVVYELDIGTVVYDFGAEGGMRIWRYWVDGEVIEDHDYSTVNNGDSRVAPGTNRSVALAGPAANSVRWQLYSDTYRGTGTTPALTGGGVITGIIVRWQFGDSAW